MASPSGGLHYYFTYDEDIKQTSNAKLEIDTRCDGGYIVGPGSKIDGNEYKIIIMSISNSLIIYLLIFLLLLFIFEVSFEYTLIFSFFSFSIAYAVILFYKFMNLKF